MQTAGMHNPKNGRNRARASPFCLFCPRKGKRGDWGRGAVFYLARKYAGMTLKEIGEAAGGIKYPAVGQLVKRFERWLHADRTLRGEVEQLERMLNVQT